MARRNPTAVSHARELRERQTHPESLLWSVLRGRRLCGLKFRRQFPIEPFIADFACLERRLVVEVDGDYHDIIDDKDLRRQRTLEAKGWQVIRFTNEDVVEDPESIAIAIARFLGLEPVFKGRAV